MSVAFEDHGEIVPGRGTTYRVRAPRASLPGLSPERSSASSLDWSFLVSESLVAMK